MPVLGDLENDRSLDAYVKGADAVVFAAGAGPGSGDARKRTVDLGGAVKLVDAAEEHGVRRYVQISSIGADRPGVGRRLDARLSAAKAEADAYLTASDLDWTVVRPVRSPTTPAPARSRSPPRWATAARSPATTWPR